jgi:hypothetical protein
VVLNTLKAGALYFAQVFGAGWVFGPIRELWVVPRLGRTAGVLLEAPLMLVVMIAVARWTVRRLAVSAALETRAAMGLAALGLLLAAEVAGMRWLRGLSIADYLAGFRSVAGGITLLLFLLFAAMPALVERR